MPRAASASHRRTVCSRGHVFWKSAATPVCPQCWPGKYRKAVDAYIANAPPATRAMLKQLRAAILAAVPEAREYMSYGIPFYEYKAPGFRGRLAYFAGFTKHVSIYAWGRDVDRVPGLKKYKTSVGTIQFPVGTRIPVGLVQRAVRVRMRAIDRELRQKS